ncbi:hypothetical protein ABTM62_19270, partial [Acinetobacter baumannii]
SPNVFFFDKDRGAEACIRALGGRYDVLRPESPSGLNPRSIQNTPANRAFLISWLSQLLGEQTRLEPEDLELITDAVDANFDQPPEHRRLRY